MDLGTKIGVVIGFAGIALTLVERFLSQEVRTAPRWLRISIFTVSVAMLLVGSGVVFFWPAPITGLGPRLEISHLEWFTPKGKTVPEAHAYIKNTGDRSAIDFDSEYSVGFSPKLLSPAEIDDIFQQLSARARAPQPESSREIEPGSDGLWIKLVDLDPKDQTLTSAQKDKMARYVFLLMLYHDQASRKTLQTDYCIVYWLDDRLECDGHNRAGAVWQGHPT